MLLLSCGCREELSHDCCQDASLQLRITAPEYGLELKSVSSDPYGADSWTAWERAVDGRYIYRATAFILQGSRLVAHKDIELDGEPEEVFMDFEANFTHGSYTLMVVANYSAHEAEDGGGVIRSYAGMEDFTSVVEEILEHTSIDDFTDIYSNSFLNYRITSDEGVCRRVPQSLSLVRDIELHPGTNVITGELVRSYARVRISVENNSDEVLQITSMDFTDSFTQTRAYIFDGQGYIREKTAMDVASANALTPFTGTPSAPATVPAKGSAVIFDAYVLESSLGDGEEYAYVLGLGYDGMDNYTLGRTQSIRTAAGVSSGHYLIYNRNSSRFLTAGTSSVKTGQLGTLSAGMTVPEEYVWALDGNGLQNNQYYIGTAAALDQGQTAYYMNNPSGISVTLGAVKSVYFTFANRNSYMTLRSSGSGNYRYLSVSNGNALGQRNNTNNNVLFELYPVDVPVASTVRIPVRTIDNATGQAEDVTEIDRNDFINAIVKVSYSKNQGHFNFEVNDWNAAGGDVSFN